MGLQPPLEGRIVKVIQSIYMCLTFSIGIPPTGDVSIGHPKHLYADSEIRSRIRDGQKS